MTVTATLVFPCPVFAAKPAPAAKPSNALSEYVGKPDTTYGWRKRSESSLGAGLLVELTLTSQTWHEIVWKHQLFIYRPSVVKTGAQALLFIGGGKWSDSLEKPTQEDKKLPDEVQRLAALGEILQSPIVVLLQVPQQPIFDGMVEDQIISFTFEKFLRSGEADWPLLLPMVKSAVRAMDAAQAFATEEWQIDIEHFLVAGASKRGWTTWLTGAVDPRVNAIAPMVINMLNMAPHMELQKQSFGEMSDELHDYTEKGLQDHIATSRGGALRAIVDPYSYRHEVQQPKLIILGTNDRYWPVDALNLYWDSLEGQKHILYVPNNGHGLRDYPRIVGTVAALYASLNGGPALPKLDWQFSKQAGDTRLEVSTDIAPTTVKAWTATSDTRDFREAKWTSYPAKQNGDGNSFVIDLPQPRQGFAAVFAEAQYNGKSLPFYLSTDLRVVAAASPAAEK